MSVWVNPIAIANNMILIASNVAALSDYWATISSLNNNKWRASLYDGTQNPSVQSAAPNIITGQWQQVVFVRDRATNKLLLYYNGKSAATPVTDQTTVVPVYSAFNIGFETGGNVIQASVDDVRIWNRALSAQEIQQVYLDSLSGYQKTLNEENKRLSNYAQFGITPNPTNTNLKGVDVRQTANQIVFRQMLTDSSGNIVTAGPTSIYLYELQNDGGIRAYDFTRNQFTVNSLVSPSATMSQQMAAGGTLATGLWTYALTNPTALTPGTVYLTQINNSNASPSWVVKEFQFGNAQGDDGAFTEFIVTAGSTTNTVNTNRTETSGFWNKSVLAFTTGSLKGISIKLNSYTGGGAFATNISLPTAPVAGDRGLIVGTE
jgi:hypothetical protein